MTDGKVAVRLRILISFLMALAVVPGWAQSKAALPDIGSAGALGADLFQRSGATGMVLVVVRGNQAFFGGYGETAPGSRRAPDAESVVRLCSLTKIFTTDVLTKMVADKTVRLSDRLARFAPAKAAVPERGKAITLEDLATHTAGLAREVGTGPRGTPHFTYPDYRTRWRWLAKQRLRSVPGTAALYSNVAFDLLGDALASAAKTDYAALLAKRTLDPLKMRETTFFPDRAQCARLMVGSGDEGPCTSTAQTEGSSGLYSTAKDMQVWLKYLVGGAQAAGEGAGSQVARAPLAQSKAAQAAYVAMSSLASEQGLDHAGHPTGLGLGWMHLLPEEDASRLVEKTGGGAGYTTYIAISPVRHAAVFLAATEGSDGPYFNLFKAANDLLLTVAGLPAMPVEKPKAAPSRVHRRRKR